MTAPRFSDPALEAIANEFAEVFRVKHDAEAKLVELFDKFTEESAFFTVDSFNVQCALARLALRQTVLSFLDTHQPLNAIG
jgi:hypothetical protein